MNIAVSAENGGTMRDYLSTGGRSIDCSDWLKELVRSPDFVDLNDSVGARYRESFAKPSFRAASVTGTT